VIKIATVAELLVKIGADSSGLRKEINATQRQLKRAFGPESLELSEGAAGVLAGIAAAMGAIGIASVKMAADMQASRTAFTQLLGSADKANAMLKDLATFAADTPFELPGLVNASKRLLGMGFAAEDVIPMMSAVGDSIALLGGGQDAINGVVRALGQIQAKGKLSAEEINQLADNNIQAWKYVASELGVSIPQAMEMTKNGAVDATTAINGIVKGMQSEFKGGMTALSKEIPGLLSTIKDNAGAVMREMGDQITDALDLKARLQGVADYLNTFASAVENSGLKNAILGMVPPEATAAVFALGGALVAVAIPAIYTFAAGLWLAIAPMAPFIALGAAIGLLAYEIWKNWEPLGGLFSGLWSAITSSTSAAWGNIQRVFYSGVQSVLQMMIPLANLVGGGLQAALSSWLDTLPGKIEAASSQAAEANTKLAESLASVKKAASGLNVGMVMKDISSLMPSAANKPNTTFTGLHGNGSPAAAPDDGATKKAADKAAKEWEKLEDKAEQVSKSIQREWVQTTKTQMEQLDIWVDEQNRELDKTAAANVNYEEDKKKVAAIYSERRIKILRDEAQKAREIAVTIRDAWKELQYNTTSSGLAGNSADLAKMASDHQNAIDAISDKWDKLSQQYATATATEKSIFIKNLQDRGVVYKKIGEDEISFEANKLAEKAALNEQYNQKLLDRYATGKDLQADIDAAYNANSMAMLQAALTKENAIQQSNRDAQLEMMKLFEQARADATLTSAEVISRIGSTAYDGFKSGLADIFAGTKSIGDAWNELGGVIRKVIANMVAEWIAGKIAMALFGKASGDETSAKSVTQGAATAAAWWPAAIAVSLATFGANAGPAIGGMAAATVAGMGMGMISGKATGGPINGPGTGTSDSILTWLSNGEYVIKASAVRELGIDALNTLNTGQMPAFASGGLVTGPSLSSLGSKYSGSTGNQTNRRSSTTTDSSSQSPSINGTINVNMLDTKGFKKFLKNSGGAEVQKFFVGQAKAFGVGVRI
jgi:tape measure domain-containing protein